MIPTTNATILHCFNESVEEKKHFFKIKFSNCKKILKEYCTIPQSGLAAHELKEVP